MVLHWTSVAAQPKQVPAFGRFLRGLREARQLSQWQVLLALKDLQKKGMGTALSGSGLSRYESGDREKPDPVVLLCLAEIYKIDITSLISRCCLILLERWTLTLRRILLAR